MNRLLLFLTAVLLFCSLSFALQLPTGGPPLANDTITATTTTNGAAGSGQIKAVLDGITIAANNTIYYTVWEYDAANHRWEKYQNTTSHFIFSPAGSFSTTKTWTVTSGKKYVVTATIQRGGVTVASYNTGTPVIAP